MPFNGTMVWFERVCPAMSTLRSTVAGFVVFAANAIHCPRGERSAVMFTSAAVANGGTPDRSRSAATDDFAATATPLSAR
jgi:hypothetical protein